MIQADNKGRLWVAHENGLAVIDCTVIIQEDKLERIFSPKILSPPPGEFTLTGIITRG
jgi:hypothetical protein